MITIDYMDSNPWQWVGSLIMACHCECTPHFRNLILRAIAREEYDEVCVALGLGPDDHPMLRELRAKIVGVWGECDPVAIDLG